MKKEGTPLLDEAGHHGTSGIGCFTTLKSSVLLTFGLTMAHIVLREGVPTSMAATLPDMKRSDFVYSVSLLPGIGTGAHMAGKIVQIWSVDAFGPRWMLIFSAVLAGVAMLVVSACTRAIFWLLAVMWSIAHFANAQTFGSVTRIAANWADPDYYGRAVMSISIGYNAGGIIMLGVFALVLQFSYWRVCYVVAGTGLVVISVVELFLLRGSRMEAGFPPPALRESRTSHPLHELPVSRALLLLLRHGRVLLFIAVSVFVDMSYTFFHAYLTSYVQGRLGYSSTAATLLLAMVFACMLAGNLIAGYVNDKWEARRVRLVCGAIGALALASGVTYIIAQCVDDPLILAWLFPLCTPFIVIGISVMEVNLGVFNIRFGGPRHSSTLAGFSNAASGVCDLAWTFYAGHLADTAQWIPLVVITVSFALTGMTLAMLLLSVDAYLPPFPDGSEGVNGQSGAAAATPTGPILNSWGGTCRHITAIPGGAPRAQPTNREGGASADAEPIAQPQRGAIRA